MIETRDPEIISKTRLCETRLQRAGTVITHYAQLEWSCVHNRTTGYERQIGHRKKRYQPDDPILRLAANGCQPTNNAIRDYDKRTTAVVKRHCLTIGSAAIAGDRSPEPPSRKRGQNDIARDHDLTCDLAAFAICWPKQFAGEAGPSKAQAQTSRLCLSQALRQ